MGPSINGLRQEPLPPGEPFSVPKMDGLFLLIGGGGGLHVTSLHYNRDSNRSRKITCKFRVASKNPNSILHLTNATKL